MVPPPERTVNDMNEMRALTIDEFDAVSGGKTFDCTVTKVVECFAFTIIEGKCDNGQTVRIIAPAPAPA